jgi:hypothetical protein
MVSLTAEAVARTFDLYGRVLLPRRAREAGCER